VVSVLSVGAMSPRGRLAQRADFVLSNSSVAASLCEARELPSFKTRSRAAHRRRLQRQIVISVSSGGNSSETEFDTSRCPH